MGLTVTNTNTMTLLAILNRTQARQSTVLTQLSTGLRINRGADNPAGLIALKNLEAEITAIDASLENNQRTDAVLGVADSGLSEIFNLLTEIETLVIASSSDANISNAERSANQSQIDLAISSIDRIVNTTVFNGKQLLNGEGAIDRTVSDSTEIQDVRVFNRGSLSSNLVLTIDITTDSARASFLFAGMSTATTSGVTEVAISGPNGTVTIDIADNLSALEVASAINAAVDSTGASAIVSGQDVFIEATTTGSASFISVDILTGGFIEPGPADTSMNETAGNVTGTDAVGTINGQTFTADGVQASFNVAGISGSFTVALLAADGTETITVETTGGFTFQLGAQSSTRVTIGIDALFAHKLGGSGSGGFLNQISSGGSADLSTAARRATALDVVRQSIIDVAVAQGRIGGFQKFQVQPAINNLQAQRIGLSIAASVIGDTDYAVATAELNKQSVLLNSGISLLGLANQQAAQILALLGG